MCPWVTRAQTPLTPHSPQPGWRPERLQGPWLARPGQQRGPKHSGSSKVWAAHKSEARRVPSPEDTPPTVSLPNCLRLPLLMQIDRGFSPHKQARTEPCCASAVLLGRAGQPHWPASGPPPVPESGPCRDSSLRPSFSLPPCEEGRVRGWSWGRCWGQSPHPESEGPPGDL